MGEREDVHLSAFFRFRDDFQPHIFKDPSLDIIHHVKLCADNRRVTAVAINLGHWYRLWLSR